MEGWVSEQFRICWVHSSVYRNHNNSQTRLSSPSVISRGMSIWSQGSSGLVGSFLCLRRSGYVPVPRVRSCRDWCIYRYICRLGGFLARGGCYPKRIWFPLRGCLRSRSRVRAYRAHFTSGLEVSYWLRIATAAQTS